MVLEYLGSLQMRGILRAPVDAEARGILREWMLAARRGEPRVKRAATPPQDPAPRPGEPAEEPAASNEDFNAMRLSLNVDDPAPAQDAPPPFLPGGRNAQEAWQAMRTVLPAWEPVAKLGTLRNIPVFGEGNPEADIMMVADAPGYQDEKAGRPVQGEAGEKLDGMLKAMGLERKDVYLTPLVKFRPSQPRQTFNTRPPSEQEVRAFLPVLDFEIALVRPKVIVAFGVLVARALLQRGNLPLSDYQGCDNSYRGLPVVVTHHPSYLLRTSDLAERRRLWEEMLRVMELVGLPVSERQRGYFLPKN